MSFGSETVASNLHQENCTSCQHTVPIKDFMVEETDTVVLDVRLLDLKPARTHDLSLEYQKLESTGLHTK